ncbi:glutamate ABC transporter substrate-binding protein [Streptomyces tropicalis]|uniref:Glutamate ABC transporter substrate-binding protein n=1 Tax=Streptomyces tropicalis TaxID=3034234 RepID=A0ABT5ZYV3_9ACTN|nr:glutamate ABC transporter substrate-binding protein [Streptomyces tropicalis]MDF3297567.1 glutamate ABC transporter substrate-binding protein [Streptomyces tropicalis]
MRARRLRAGLRGWGGVGAMAAVCALALAWILLLPLARPHGAGGAPAGDGGQTARATQARAGSCTDADAQNRSLPPSAAEGATVRAIKERGYLSVGVDQNSYRWGYLNPNNASGALEGFDIDLAHRIARDLLGDADKVQFRAIPTNERVPAIRSGRVDMVVRTMTITCDRLEQVAFSAPYFLTGQQVLAPRTSAVTGYDGSLAGRRICSAEGSTAYDHLSADKKSGRLPASTDISTTVPNQLDCLVRLQLGECDAVVTDGALAASQAAQDPTVALKGDTFTREYYGVAMKLGADDLVRRVNRVLEDYRKDGGWKASYDKWLSPTLGKDSESATPPAASYR